MSKLKKISIIGSGNIGFHLGKALKNQGATIHQVYSRKLKNALELASTLEANQAINDLSELDADCDLILVAVKDDAIAKVITQIPFCPKLIAHTSGSVPMDVFEQVDFTTYGIFYPLQSFSKNRKVDMKTVPFCLESNHTHALGMLSNLAHSISSQVYHINSKERETIHLAAVFANNFTNFMYQIANDILVDHCLPFEILKPLILETAKKIQDLPPKEAQTGPAKRNDQHTIEKHLAQLRLHPEYQKLYQDITKLIIQSSKNT